MHEKFKYIHIIGKDMVSFKYLYTLYVLIVMREISMHIFPTPTGPYSVGTTSYNWVDENRIDIFSRFCEQNFIASKQKCWQGVEKTYKKEQTYQNEQKPYENA